MTELRDAIDELVKAQPTPDAVARFARETIHKRDHPYEPNDVDDPFSHISIKALPEIRGCNLCGAALAGGSYWYHAIAKHVDWHNRIESRIAKLERGTE